MKKIISIVAVLVFVCTSVFAKKPSVASTSIVISQIYGAGGNAGALYNADYVELHNKSNVAVTLNGYSIQYASPSATGTWSGKSKIPTVTIPAGGYYLIQMSAAGITNGVALPTPDYVSSPTISMSGANARIALVSDTVTLSGCPTTSNIIDLVGYGTATVCSETAPTDTLGVSKAAFRNNNGCDDTNNNFADFSIASPNPRNSLSPIYLCGTVIAAPINDDPCNAIYISSDTVCNFQTFSNIGATASQGIVAPGCANYIGGDVWFYTFVPASGSLNFDTQSGVIRDGGMAIYSGGNCGALNLLACDDDASVNGLMPKIQLNGLTPGDTIWIRFWEYGNDNNGTFGICVNVLPPSNDEPCNATPLNVGTSCSYVNASNSSATASIGIPDPGCAGYLGGDVWFSAIVPANGAIYATTQASVMTDGGMAFYSGTCDSLILITCDDNSGAGNMPEILLSNLVPGSTLWIRMWENGNNNNGNFGICVSTITPLPTCSSNQPAGNSCGQATSICNFNGYCGTTNDNIYTPDSWPSLAAAFCGSIENNSFLSFVALSDTVSFNVWVPSSRDNLGMQMMFYETNNCDSGNVISHGCYSPIAPSKIPRVITGSGFIPGQTYYIMFDGYAGDSCEYRISPIRGVAILNLTPSNPIICAGSNVTLTASGGTNYTWTGAGLNTYTGAVVVATPIATTTYQVAATSSNCNLLSSITINVNNCNAFCDSVGIANNDTTICSGSSITLNTTVSSSATASSLTDIDSNIYPTVNIGTQTWSQKNLNVSRYKNGDIIPQVTNATQWAAVTTGAWCWYNNDSATYAATYGRLYNWYAVNDPRGIAPEGWHVPSDADWSVLETYLGGVDLAGGAMKESGLLHWQSPNTGANNSSGLSGLPGGIRYSYGTFSGLGSTGYCWYSTAYSTLGAYGSGLYYSGSIVFKDNNHKNDGFSVRILKNTSLTYLWSTGATTPTINISPTQTTTYYCTISNGISSCTDSVVVSVNNNCSDFCDSVNITNNDTTICSGSSIALTAAAVNSASVTDINGNVYPTVNIGTQTWMQKNLSVSKYKNGDVIPQVTNATQWAALTSGAWCWYNNDSANYAATYGKLYNWYAVNDSRGLAPNGWHVPSDGEWNALVKYLDINSDTTCGVCTQSSTAGGTLKEVGLSHWRSPNAGAINTTGFTGYSGGARYNDGSFSVIGFYGNFWSATSVSLNEAFEHNLYYDNASISNAAASKKYALIVRAISNTNAPTYLWSTGATSPTINVSPTQTTTYYCTISNGISSCTDSVVVSVNNNCSNFCDSAKINNNDTTICSGSNITLTASGSAGSGFVTDIDGNAYPIVNIGTQTWIAENLKTTHFANGDIINNVIDGSWSNTTNPAWAYYNNNQTYNSPYGKLYNYYVASDTRNACPVNWHVPTLKDFDTLLNNLGGHRYAGGKMKDTLNWNLPNVGATNSSGFTAVPAGLKYMGGPFGGIGGATCWWTSTQSPGNAQQGKAKFTNNGIDSIIDYDDWKNVGWSIRCLSNQRPTTSTLTYLWSTGATTPTINVSPTQTTTYYCTVTNGISICRDSVTISVFNPVIFSQDTILACGSSYALNAGAGNSSYSWNTGAASQTISVTSTGWYKCTVGNGACYLTDSVFVSLVNANINFSNNSICKGQAVSLNITSPYVISQSIGVVCATVSENNLLGIQAPLNAIFTRVNFASYGTPNGSCGNFTSSNCNASNSQSVVESYLLGQSSGSIPASNAIFGDPCPNIVKRLYVEATYTKYDTTYTNTYNWSTGDSTTTITVSPTINTTYSCTVSNGINSCSSSVTISVFNPVIFTQDTILACGSSYALNAVVYSSSYLWNTGATTKTIDVTSSGWYKCLVGNGTCFVTDSVFVSLLNANIIQSDTAICSGTSFTLDAQFGISSNPVTDINGNMYPTVNIGSQTWMQKNLNISRYKNGDIIPQVTDAAQWVNLTTGAWCWYNNDSTTYAATYGKLYNWYAVNDSRGLAPDGWHVPTITEINNLISTSGGSSVAMKSLKEIGNSHWNTSNNIGGTNSTGFTALPGGLRRIDGSFEYINLDGLWHLNSSNAQSSYYFAMRNAVTPSSVYSYLDDKRYGYSVRCVKDISSSVLSQTYLWSTGATSTSINIAPTQTTTFSCTVSNGINSCIDSVLIKVINNDIFNTDTITANCTSSYNLDAGVGYPVYRWSTGDTTRNIIVTSTGWYKCTVSNSFCSGIDSVYVIFNPSPVLSVLTSSAYCPFKNNGSIVINTIGSPISFYSIDNGVTLQSLNQFQNLYSGTYSLYVKDIYGCTATSRVTLGYQNTICDSIPVINICSNPCFTLSTKIPDYHFSAATYNVSKVNSSEFGYNPYVSPSDIGTSVGLATDDTYSSVIPIGFTFPFFNDTTRLKSSLIISPNGFVSFDVSNAGAFSHYRILNSGPIAGTPQNLPSSLYDRSIIMGAYHDLDISVKAGFSPACQIKYDLLGIRPNRVFVVSYYAIPLFSTACNNLIQNTHQIALHEGTGEIEVFLNSIQQCSSWNSGKSMVGIQNDSKTLAYSPIGRRASDVNWGSVNMNEIWRFRPSAASSSFRSVELYDLNGNLLSVGDTTGSSNGELNVSFPQVCISQTTSFVVKSTYYNITFTLPTSSLVVHYDTIRVIADNSSLSNQFNPFPDSLRTCNLPYQLDASTTGVDSYFWNTGDTSRILNVSSSGWYVCYVSKGQCDAVDSVYIAVNPHPRANFTYIPNSGCGRTKVSFTDSSSISSGNISSWIWDFGDGDSSTSQSPVHIFRPTPGDSGYQTFNVRLIVFSNNGCSDTITRTITIKRGPDATLLSSADATDYNGEPYFIVCTSNTNANLTFFNATTTSFSNTRYVINWGDGTPNIDSLNWQNGASVGITHNYAAGTYKLTYYVYAGGCLDSTVYNVFVGGNPAGGINISSPYSCSKNDQLFVISNTGNNTPGTLYIFSTTDASLSDTFVHPIPNLDSIYHRFEVSSCGYTFNGGFNTYQNAFGATLKMINPCGTTTSFVAPIYVSDKSVASFTNVSSDTICTTQSITLINNSVPGNSVINGVCTPGKSVWSVSSPTAGANYNVVSGSLGSAATANPAIWTLGSDSLVLNFTAPGVYYVKIKAANNSSCSGDSVVKTIYVNAIPVIGDTAISLCTGNSFTFMPSNNNGNTIPVGTRYTWTALADSNIIGYSNSFVSQSALTQTLINLSNLTQQVVYTVTPVSVAPSYCTGASFKLTVTVNPKLKIADTAISVCTGSIFNFIPTTGVSGNIVPPNQVFAWSNPAISTGLTGAGGGSGTSVTDTLFNTADTIKTATYTVIAANSCGIDTFKLVVKVNPSPKLTFTPSSQNICSGDSTLNVFITASIPGTNVYWSCNPPASISGATTFGQNVIFSQALVNLSDTVVKVPYIASPSTAGLISCSSPNATYYITVNPRPKINNDTVQACSGTAFNATPVNVLPYTIVPVGTTYTWTVVGTNANVTGQSNRTSGSSTISQTLTNLTIVPQTVVYAVAARSGAAGNCVSAPFFITVVVNPKPVIPAQTATICSGSTFFVMLVNNQPTTATIVPSGTTYTWTVAANTNVAGQGNQSVGIGYISQTLVNNSNTVQRLLYTVTPLSGGCSGTPFVLTVTVNPKPAIPSQFISICSGSAFSVIPANALPRTIVPSGTTYTWTISSNTNLAGQNSQSVSQIGVRDTLTNLTNASQTIVYIVTPTTGTCVGTSFNIYVTVNPKPVIPAQTSTICSGSSFYITPVNAQPAIIVPANTTYTWTVASNANVTGENSVSTSSSYIADTLTNTSNVVQAVIYTVTPFSGACFGSPFTVTVYVYPRPLISTQYTTACSGSAFVFTAVNAAPTTIVPVGTTYTWVVVSNANVTGYSTQSTASSTISQTLTNLTNVTQVVTYYVTPTSGSCVGSAFVLNVYVYPKATIPTQTAAICSGAAFYVNPANGQPTSSTIVPSGTTYKWTVVSNANVSGESAQTVAQTSISQTLTNLTNTTQVVVYTVTPTSGSCVGASFTVYVYVYAKPVIGSQSTTVCSGTAFDYIPTNAPPTTIVPSGTTYTWIVASNTTTNVTGQTDQSVSQSAINQTLTNTTGVSQLVNYLVTPINGNCTGAPFVLIVTVNPKPLIPYQGIVGICSGSSFVVSPVDAPPTTIAPAGTKYTWTVSTNTNVTGQSAQTVAQSYISQTLTNISNTTQYVLYTVTPTLGSCIGSTFTFYVRVAPKPVIQNQTTTICSGSTFAVSPTNAAPTIIVPSGTTYTWTVSSNTNVVGQSNQSIAQAYVSQTLTNLTNVVQSVVYTVTPTSGTTGNCVGSAFYVTVVVNPKAVIPSQNPISICSGSSFSFTPVNNPPSLIVPTGTKYVWTISANSNLTGQNSQSVSKLSISDTITNLTNTDQVLLYTVTPISGNCVGASFSFEVIVNPKPVIPTQTAIICSGSNFYVLPVNGQPTSSTIVPLNTTYTWTVSSNTNVSGQSSQSIPQSGISQNLINNSNTAQTVIYTVTPLSGTYGNCQGAPFYIYVTVNPLPIISSQSTTICSGSTFVVSPVNAAPTTIVPSGTTYTWTVSSNTSVSGQGAQTVGQSYISQTLTNLSNAVQNVVYYVTPRYGSCIGSTFIVNVIVNPKASIPSQTLDICSGSTFYVNPINGQPTSSTVVPSGTTYKWTVVANANVTGESSQTIAQQYISQTLTNITNVAQTVVYTVTPTTGNCLGASFIVTVYVNPKPLVASQTTTICSGSVFLISPINASPTTIVPVGTTYTWVVASNVNVTGQSNQTVPASSISQTLTNLTNVTQSIVYTITPSSGGCVGNSFTVTVNVSPKPIIPSQGIISICSGSTFGVSPVNSQPTVIVPAGTKYTWTISTNTNITGQSAQTVAQSSISQTLTNVSNTVQYLIYTVTPISGVCTGNTFSIIVRVYPKPLIAAQAVSICSGSTFVVSPVNAQPTAIVPATTLYTWTVAVNNNVSGQTDQAVGQSIISQNLVNLTNTVQTISYTVTPVSGPNEGNCVGTSFRLTVTVNPVPKISDASLTICNGTAFNLSPVNNVPNTIVPAGTVYTWTVASNTNVIGQSNQTIGASSIGQILNNLTNTAQNVVYTVTPRSGNCYGSIFTVTITVNAKPVIPSQTISSCSGSTVVFAANNLPPSIIVPSGTIYTWTVPSNPNVTGESNQTAASTIFSQTLTNTTNAPQSLVYTVTPRTSSCIGSSFAITVTVNPKPKVANTTTAICSGSRFTFTPSSTVTGNLIPIGIRYLWSTPATPLSLTGGASGSGSSITGLLSNSSAVVQNAVYTVTPFYVGISGDTCVGNTFLLIVTVNPLPPVVVNPNPAIICYGNSITLSATGADRYTWSPAVGLSDTTSAVVSANPTSTTIYIVNGVNQTTGCSKVAEVVVTVNPTPAVTVTPLNTILCKGYSTTLIASGADSYSWSPSAGLNSSVGSSVVASPDSTTAYLVTGAVQSTGCTDTAIAYISVNPIPAMPTVTNNSPLCSGDTLRLSAQTTTTGNVIYSWQYPDLTFHAGANVTIPNVGVTSSGIYSVAVTINSCTSPVATTNVVVRQSTSSVTNATICLGQSYLFNTVSYTQSGSYTYRTTNAIGCDSLATLNLIVRTASNTIIIDTACNSYTWHGDTYTSSATYTYNATNIGGCDSIETLQLVIVPFNTNPIAQDTIIACGSSYVINAQSGYNSYLWSTGATVSRTLVTSTGWYTCMVGNGYCSYTDSVFVSIVNANIVNNDTSICLGQSIALSASNITTSGLLRDADGNTYPTVNIGNQVWSQKNLNVSRYKNGDIIPQVTDPTQWSNLTTGAWCWYNNDSASYAATYGKLYNWYAVNDPRGLALEGWHVPNDWDWNRLVKHLDANADTICQSCIQSNSAGGAMKSTIGWNALNVGATNISGFNGLPGGGRYPIGTFLNSGTIGVWWSIFEYDSIQARERGLYNDRSIIGRSYSEKKSGFSLRLISNNTNSFIWSTGDTTATINVSPTQTTTYYCTVSNGISSCTDSVVVRVKQPSSSSQSVTSCNYYTWHGNTYTQSGVYTYSTLNAVGCDSVVTLNLTIAHPTSSTQTIAACNSYNLNGVVYYTNGVYVDTLVNASGCDSIVTINLTINHADSTIIAASACNNYTWHGVTYTTSGAYTYTGANTAGCDSVITLYLTIRQGGGTTETITSCNNYTWNDTTYTQSGVYTFVNPNFQNVAIINNQGSSGSVVVGSSSYYVNESIYTDAEIGAGNFITSATAIKKIGFYVDQLGSPATVNNFKVWMKNISSTTSTFASGTYTTTGYTLVYNGAISPTSAGLYTINLTTAFVRTAGSNLQLLIERLENASHVGYIFATANGNQNSSTALSTRRYNGTVVPSSTTSLVASAFRPAIRLSGIVATDSTTCENLSTLNLTIGRPTTSTQIVNACNSYSWNGTTYSSSGSYTKLFTNASGCDSTAVLSLAINAIQTNLFATDSINVCASSYTLDAGAGYTSYLWSTGASSQLINISSTNWYKCTVANANCTASDSVFVLINSTTLPAPANLTGFVDICSIVGTTNATTYTTDAVPGAIAYQWTLPPGAVIDSGSNGLQIKVHFLVAGAKDTIAVQAIGLGGCLGIKNSLRLITTNCVTTPFAKVIKTNNVSDFLDVSVYPNPSTTYFNLKIKSSSSESIMLRVFDLQGRLVKNFKSDASKISLFGQELMAGMYLIEVSQGGRKKTVKVEKY